MTLFNDLLRRDGTEWTALQNNVAVCCLMILYGKLCLVGIAWHQRPSSLIIVPAGATTNKSKQFVYLFLSLSILFWPLFDTKDWSWRLNAVLPTAVLVRFFYKGAILNDPADSEVQTLSRSSSPTELLFGPIQFTAVLVVLGLFRFMDVEAAVVMAALGFGDAMAPLVGSRFGRHFYQMPLLGPVKTMEGSVCGLFLGSCAGIYFFLYGLGMPLLPLRIVLVYAAIAAIVEGTSPGNVDNLAVPVVLHFCMDRVQQWLPA